MLRVLTYIKDDTKIDISVGKVDMPLLSGQAMFKGIVIIIATTY
jgi:hypothetical protein